MTAWLAKLLVNSHSCDDKLIQTLYVDLIAGC